MIMRDLLFSFNLLENHIRCKRVQKSSVCCVLLYSSAPEQVSLR